MSNQIDNTQNISNLITLVSTGKLKNKSVRANGTAGKKPEQRVASLPYQAHTLGVCACPTLSPSGSGGRPRPLGVCVCAPGCSHSVAALALGGGANGFALSRVRPISAPCFCRSFRPLRIITYVNSTSSLFRLVRTMPRHCLAKIATASPPSLVAAKCLLRASRARSFVAVRAAFAGGQYVGPVMRPFVCIEHMTRRATPRAACSPPVAKPPVRVRPLMRKSP